MRLHTKEALELYGEIVDILIIAIKYDDLVLQWRGIEITFNMTLTFPFKIVTSNHIFITNSLKVASVFLFKNVYWSFIL